MLASPCALLVKYKQQGSLPDHHFLSSLRPIHWLFITGWKALHLSLPSNQLGPYLCSHRHWARCNKLQ